MYWDEDNRLMVLSDNGKTSRYTYNAAGERIMKSHGTMEGVYINGAPQGITFHETDNFTLYPASILSVNKNRFTKHYFLGDKRIASRIGTGLFNNVYGRNGSYVTAGQQDYAERMNQIQKQKEAYYKQQGIAPGVPTMKGAYGDPENTGVGYNAVLTELGNHDVPQGWIQTPHPNTTPNTNPGPPVSWNDPSNPNDPQAGYGYIPNDTTKEETFFYHSDHLGSTSYITDDHANITQYDAYLPYGELLVYEHSSSEDLPYKFNGKQFDEETGLYYYGARYMDPKISLWYGSDPLSEEYENVSTFVYCHGNPICLFDPDGQGDYYTNGGVWLGSDQKKDNFVYTASGVHQSKDKNGSMVNVFENPQKLSISHSKFISQSSTVYGESSAYRVRDKKSEPSEDLKKEMYAIASVHQRNSKAYGISSEPAKDFRSKSAKERNDLPLMRTAIAAEINALKNGIDYSYGATMWDGAEQAQFSENEQRKSNGHFEIHMNTMGWNISPKHYAQWKNNIGKSFKAPMIRAARDSFYNSVTKKSNPNPNAGKMRLQSTAVYGRTIFWKTN
ncbi:RHS repeat domain-containing protein [Prevotella melaninogenica]|uniref:RHS repeat domain-containing protein n=1 Tax=Prevotella melaninogenica TaxID=28132 RepID=UPI002151CB5C|nr:RHS repeat-associated core domain-containing protein [Prevotella melaninogenica]